MPRCIFMAGDCGHHTCVGCATEAARTASGDRTTITASGVPCPFSGCPQRLGLAELKRLVAVGSRTLPDPRAVSGYPEERMISPLGDAELHVVSMVMEEESIPQPQRAWCPNQKCGRVLDLGLPQEPAKGLGGVGSWCEIHRWVAWQHEF